MTQYEGSRQVYDELVERSDDNWLLGLLAFAIVEEQRIEWERHVERNSGSAPASEDVSRWYRELPEVQLLRARGEAKSALESYASQVWAGFRAEERDRVRDGALAEEIRAARRFWPQFGVGVASGVVSSFVFALLLLLVLWIAEKDPSPIAVGRGIIRDEGSKVQQP